MAIDKIDVIIASILAIIFLPFGGILGIFMEKYWNNSGVIVYIILLVSYIIIMFIIIYAQHYIRKRINSSNNVFVNLEKE